LGWEIYSAIWDFLRKPRFAMKKLQVFISSTYLDLRVERQAAVQAILTAGHMPAGMELFTANDQSQLETIYRWIDESDIFILILGGRYGSIENNSRKSYTHLEYEYALSRQKAVFAIVMQKEALAAKVKDQGPDVLELANRSGWEDFCALVLSKMCGFFSDVKDIQIEIHKALAKLQRERMFTGWVSGASVPNTEQLASELTRLSIENASLRQRIQELEKENQGVEKKREFEVTFGGLTFEELAKILENEKIEIPAALLIDNGRSPVDLLDLFFANKASLTSGVTNRVGVESAETFLFHQVGSRLIAYGLAENEKVAGVIWHRIRTTKLGNLFLTQMAHRLQRVEKVGSRKGSAS